MSNEGHSTSSDESVAAALMATAYHEAGHAVVAVELGRIVHKLTIRAGQTEFGGLRLGQCQLDRGRRRAAKDLVEDEAMIMLAGMIAESRFTGKYSYAGARSDLQVVGRLLENRVKTERQFERAQQRLIDKTEYLLDDPVIASVIERVAQELVERTTVSGRAVQHFLNEAKQRPASYWSKP